MYFLLLAKTKQIISYSYICIKNQKWKKYKKMTPPPTKRGQKKRLGEETKKRDPFVKLLLNNKPQTNFHVVQTKSPNSSPHSLPSTQSL